MKCPYCGYTMSKVLNSRPVEENKAIRRRRQCEQCTHRFTTYEKMECIPMTVLKTDLTRENYDREKMLRGILRSCNKRPISREQVEDLVEEIENEIHIGERHEISSSEIGEIAMHKLRKMDEVAYIRFASVYKKFKTIDEFIEELEQIKRDQK